VTEDHTVSKPVKIKPLKNIVTVCCGTTASGALTADGKVWLWGGGHGGKELPEPVSLTTVSEKVESLVYGATHFFAKTSSGKLISWGSNTFGELGRETKTVDAQYKVETVPETKGLTNISAVACGRNYTAMLADGKLWVCGKGAKGVLGTGKMSNEDAPVALDSLKEKIAFVACGSTHTLAVSADGKLFGCGSKDHGRLGNA